MGVHTELNPYSPPQNSTAVPPLAVGTFHGLDCYAIAPDRLYKFYISQQALCAAHVGGQFFNANSARVELFPLYFTLVGIPFCEAIAAWSEARGRELEERYDGLIGDPESVLGADRRNFHLPRTAVQSIVIKPGRHFRAKWLDRGVMTIYQSAASPRKLFIIDRRQLGEIADDLAKAGYPVFCLE